VLHQRLHFHHVSDVQGMVKARAASRDSESDNPATSAQLESVKRKFQPSQSATESARIPPKELVIVTGGTSWCRRWQLY
jgi:hypothetical protein